MLTAAFWEREKTGNRGGALARRKDEYALTKDSHTAVRMNEWTHISIP